MMDQILEQRLSRLPVRSAQPFRQLLETSQLTEEIIHSVLDAGELAGDRTRLVGFAVGFLHLRSQGVPVHDVIRMAKQQKRRINLAWSPKRWRTEHERLSRAEALNQLAGENVRYDVSRFAAHLTAPFPGYLIRSSRRLGMEGLRQRHCVASYHHRLVAGSCAIACVFVDKVRWTVELRLTDDPERPLRIYQIKTRHNAPASAAAGDTIHHLLGIHQPVAPQVEADAERLYMQNLQRLLPILREHRIRSVGVSFDGGGDSGSIDYVTPYPIETQERFDALTAEYLKTERMFDDGLWRSVVTPTQGSIREAIEALTYDYLEETDVDWYNNDGGYGELTIDVEEGTVKLEIHVRFSDSDLQYSGEYDIETGEEL